DYGIAGGLGVEYSRPGMGHFLIEGRYYYGLGNIYGASKRDYFGVSNFSNISLRLTYLFDLKTTKGVVRK
ncbi:MAG: PorT family protein, partial [Prevotella sp.]|nr:PorT family protein [Prevotella sp.]